MQAFTKHHGLVALMDRANVDTDQIIPKQFLKRIERTGFGQFLFYDWRFLDDGQPHPDFELNHPHVEGCSILVARRNFGSGSSREHAVWALADYGIRAVIAPSFADIFYNNSFKNGLLPVVLPESAVNDIFAHAADYDRYHLHIDLEDCVVTHEHGLSFPFEVDPAHRENMLGGLDDIDRTLQHADEIAAYEASRGMKPVS